jgi:GT2 family glycosyltransferase
VSQYISISIVIPTYGRENVLLETLRGLLSLKDRAEEILVIDQTTVHDAPTTEQLNAWNATSEIRWIRREKPGIPQAMNSGLLASRSEVVLFLDDDIEPVNDLVQAHRRAHTEQAVAAVVGQVIQPWQKATPLEGPRKLSGLQADFDFPFHSTISQPVPNVMAGNLSVRRTTALKIGGFDEQFVGSAYRFESEFARRLMAAGERIWFAGDAGIRHLRVPSGGTRQQGDHRASADPRHGVGDYYFALRHGGSAATAYMCRRMLREVSTKFHLQRPWYIPIKLWGELRAWRWAVRMVRTGPRLLSTAQLATSDE